MLGGRIRAASPAARVIVSSSGAPFASGTMRLGRAGARGTGGDLYFEVEMIRQSIAGLALLAVLSGCGGGEEGGTVIEEEQQESGTEDPVIDVAPGVVGSGAGRGAGMDSALLARPDSGSAATIGTVGGGPGGGAATPPPASGGN
jgi:hypothetical protein